MWCLVLAHEDKGLVLVAAFKPSECLFCDDVGAVAGVAFALAVHLNEVRIVVAALAGKDLPVVESGRVGLQMPFADESCLVACALEHLWKGGLSAVKVVSIAAESVDVAVLAGEDTCAGGTADGVGTEGIDESGAFVGDPVNIRRLIDLGAVGANGLECVIVTEDENDVGLFLCCHRRGRQQQGQKEEKGALHEYGFNPRT